MLQPFKRWGSLLAQAEDELLTAQVFDLLPQHGLPRTLIRGRVREDPPPGERHNQVVAAFAVQLAAWASSGMDGCSGSASSFVLARDPDTVRTPDSFFVQAERVPHQMPQRLWPIAPDLAVEVVTPYETAEDVCEQIHDYLAAGTALVWAIYPRAHVLVAHMPGGVAHTYGCDAVLQAPEFMPGFTCALTALFEDTPQV